jgi:hypothetical protein
MDKKTALKGLIAAFEKGNANVQQTLDKIKELTGKEIEETYLRGDWQGISLDDFCDELLTAPITDWQQIEDNRAQLLIREIFDNVTSSGIVNRNIEALTKRYGKTTGFLSDIIFHTNINDPLEILELLKKDTAIYL